MSEKNIMLSLGQTTYLSSPYIWRNKRWHFLVAGYGYGKTFTNTVSVIYAVQNLQGKFDFSGHGARIIVAGYTLAHLELTFMRYFREWLTRTKSSFREDTKNHIFEIGTVTVLILPMENPDKLFGEDVCACYCEEIDELPEDKMIEACNSLSQRTRQIIKGFRTPYLCLASTAQGKKGIYRLITNFDANGVGYILTRGFTEDNYHVDKEYIMSLYKMFTPEEREVYMHGKFLNVNKNKVFPNFDWSRHYSDNNAVYETLGKDDNIFIAQDFNSGFFRGSAWTSRNGVMWCIKRYNFSDISNCMDVYRHDFPTQKIWWIPDVTIKDQYPLFAAGLRRNDIRILHRSKNFLVEDTVFLVNILLRMDRIKFAQMAADTAQMVDLAERDKDGKIGKGKTAGDWQHDVDSVRYAVSLMTITLSEFRDIRSSIITHIASLRKTVENDDDRQFNKAGYMTISADEAMEAKKWKKTAP